MKRLLILFTIGFPYNVSEPFLEKEYPLYKEHYDKVLIVTACKKSEKPTRQIDDPTIEILNDYTMSKDLRSIIEAIPATICDKMFYRELKHLFFSQGFSFHKLYKLVVISLCANHRAMLAKRWLKNHPEFELNTIYSYWLQITAYAAIRLNQKLGKKCHTISRVHRFDLYSEFSTTGYLPFQRQLFEQLDEVAAICDDGKQYLESEFGASEKISIHRLGALDQGMHNPVRDRVPFKIVSCSRVAPIKRLNKIVDALRLITDRQIHWTHLGGGEGLEELTQYAADQLPQNVTVSFPGMIPNTQVYQTYQQEPFHAFVNVSANEGVPVSIMEAMSYDIPVIATAVGGTPELVEDCKNGYLLDSDFTDEELANCIRQLTDMSDKAYTSFRQNARSKFERDYNAVPNYRRFIESLASH